jgi:3-methyladenine DNA glycosylase/8-oxoguanine DNA glycosylase
VSSQDPLESIVNSIANLTISVKAMLKMIDSLTETLQIIGGRLTLLEGMYEKDE